MGQETLYHLYSRHLQECSSKIPSASFIAWRDLYWAFVNKKYKKVQSDNTKHKMAKQIEEDCKNAAPNKTISPLSKIDPAEDFKKIGHLTSKSKKKKKKKKEKIWPEPAGEIETCKKNGEKDEEEAEEEEDKEKKVKTHRDLFFSFIVIWIILSMLTPLDDYDFLRDCPRRKINLENIDDAHKWMDKINKFEEKHLKLPLEYRVIGDMMNRLKESTGKERFILLQKLNRAVHLMQIKEAYDPNNPANFGIIKHQQVGSPEDIADTAGFEKERQMIQGGLIEDEKDFSESKEQDDAYTKKLNDIEKELEEKLAQLDHTFGKKGRVLEEEIRDLVEERNSLTEKKRRPLYRKGFDVKVIDVNRTCKVTKGGQIVKFTALLATGNFHGVIGFAKAKAPTAKFAIQKAYEKCFQNLHYVERYEEHTIAHAIQAKYEKTKIYLWPGPRGSGVAAAVQTVETVLYLAGFSNVKSKIIGSRNPLNVIKALFIALNAVETPKDIQQKFGRAVVETYLL
ncbi:hypothetical protein KSP40_PGU006229 [Platanthera guangdongensis]|uniref:S5 DRBM domain-containing protein n=1 Tax=Platanthera guangdongensis TaxID=2320717 RepID=A0ABR2MQQ3_9ASPA